MIRINLLPEVKRKAPKRVKVARQIPFTWIVAGLVAVILAAVVALVIHLRMVEKLHERQATAVKIQEDIKHYKVQQGLVEKARKQRNALTQKLEVIATLKQRQIGPVRLLDELAASIPAKVWLSQMTEAGTALTITGYSVDHRQIAQFMENLGKSSVFTNVELINAMTDLKSESKKDNVLPVKSFELTCQVNMGKQLPTGQTPAAAAAPNAPAPAAPPAPPAPGKK